MTVLDDHGGDLFGEVCAETDAFTGHGASRGLRAVLELGVFAENDADVFVGDALADVEEAGVGDCWSEVDWFGEDCSEESGEGEGEEGEGEMHSVGGFGQ